MKSFNLVLFFFSLLIAQNLCASDKAVITFSDNSNSFYIGNQVLIYQDSSCQKTFKDILTGNLPFKKNTQEVPNLGITEMTHWVKFSVHNKSNSEKLLLEYSYPIIDEIELYSLEENGEVNIEKVGEKYRFKSRSYSYPNYIFDLDIQKNTEKTFFIKIRSNEQIMLPLKIGKPNEVISSNSTGSILFGLYAGIIMVMFLYNLFIFISIKDKSYFYYVLHTIIVGLTQASFLGYTSQYLWPENTWLAEKSTTILTCLVSIVGIEFMRSFINVKKHTPVLNKIFYAFTVSYFIIITLNLLNYDIFAYKIMQTVQSLVSIIILITSITIVRKGSRAAKFYLFAWSVLFIGILIFFLKDFGILPYNNITVYTMPIGSAVEVILLSFALADRINIMRAEKEKSQQKTLEVLQENEKIIREQNIILEQKVEERTTELNQTLSNLKDTQAQLVDAEKMSSLGQLTAGIAHEINNPINFVSSNIPPLRQDINDLNTILSKYEEIDSSSSVDEKLKEVNQLKQKLDYEYLKTELKSIVNGIEDGAKRTAQIVSGLKNFSRLDEVDLQKADVNEGINSTLVLIKNKLGNIKLTKDLAKLPLIECYPSKLNQLFMNIIDNAIQAIEAKSSTEENEIKVSTYAENDNIVIAIKDSGIGMNQETKEKIFEPFFTTKPVGEGTGLGMSIAYSIINVHNATIEINSKENEGTEIIIKIPFNNG